MERIEIVTTCGTVAFRGKHRKDLEKPNWHYYENHRGEIHHFRKEHMVAVLAPGASFTSRD